LKLTKTSWLIIIVGVFIITLAGLGVIRSAQVQEQSELREQLALAQLKLSAIQLEQLSYRQEELEQQLSETASQSKTAQATLSQTIGYITVSDTLFDVAEANNVEVTEIKSSGMVGKELAGVPCSTLPLTTRVEGELTDLVSFTTQLNEELTTGTVESVDIIISEIIGNKSSANIRLIVYAYKGS
jgi:hypothetical protein